ncbi:MAG: exodeoxyribonuclease VII small subunit [Veillonellaceae bacterium]|nr:exodeoxyribonuclease VII small subunit [Veillonellaceae bacterium]
MASSLKSYEKKYKELETIVQNLDADQMTVSQLLTQYKKGLTLVKDCSTILTSVEAEVKQLIEEVQVTE